jgi:choline-glycine betaine transporter
MFQQKKFQKHPLKVLSVLLKLHEQTRADQQRNFPTENTIIYWTWISDLFIYYYFF